MKLLKELDKLFFAEAFLLTVSHSKFCNLIKFWFYCFFTWWFVCRLQSLCGDYNDGVLTCAALLRWGGGGAFLWLFICQFVWLERALAQLVPLLFEDLVLHALAFSSLELEQVLPDLLWLSPPFRPHWVFCVSLSVQHWFKCAELLDLLIFSKFIAFFFGLTSTYLLV